MYLVGLTKTNTNKKTVSITTESEATITIPPLRTSASLLFRCLMYQVL